MRHSHRPVIPGGGQTHGHAHARTPEQDHGLEHGHGHSHQHDDGSGHDASAPAHPHVHRAIERQRLVWAMSLTGGMMVVETIAGLLTNSLALLSDAGHMLTHFFALAVSFVAIRLAAREPGPERTFGWYRFEILAALLNGITLAAITLGIGVEAVSRLSAPPAVATGQMFVVAVVGLFVNLATAVILHGASQHDLNVRSAFLHMLGDTASSVAIVAGGAVMHFTGWFIVDPLLSILVAGVIAYWSWGLLRDSLHVLLESVPQHVTVEEVTAAIVEAVPEVQEVTDLHIWEITSQMYSLTAHLEMVDRSALARGPDVIARLNAVLDQRFHIQHTTLQLDVPT